MKTLKQITESFFQNSESGAEVAKQEILDRLSKIVVKFHPKDFIINDDLTVDYSKKLLKIKTDDESFGVQFNTVRNFDCKNCKNLKNLVGSPKNVSGVFECSSCNHLESLTGAPEEVGDGFWCNSCDSLTSLEGAPKSVGGIFGCGKCKKLKTLKGAPKVVGNDFSAANNPNLLELDITNTIIKGAIYLYECTKLTSLNGFPKVRGLINISYCDSLNSLKGLPKKLDCGLNLYGCVGLESLDGCPEIINDIKMQNYYDGKFDISKTNIKTLKGCPKKIYGDFICGDCINLETLDYLPELVAGNSYMRGCKNDSLDFEKLRMVTQGEVEI